VPNKYLTPEKTSDTLHKAWSRFSLMLGSLRNSNTARPGKPMKHLSIWTYKWGYHGKIWNLLVWRDMSIPILCNQFILAEEEWKKKYTSLSSAFSFIQQLVSDCIYIFLPSLFGT